MFSLRWNGGKQMQIKELSERTGLPDKTIRFYEEVGVLPPPKRLPNGYRAYGDADVERVRFATGLRRCLQASLA